jgi:hypothetical protein
MIKREKLLNYCERCKQEERVIGNLSNLVKKGDVMVCIKCILTEAGITK